jgi:hypothetical protein
MARFLRRAEINDVEIFNPEGERISQYALDQLLRSETKPSS